MATRKKINASADVNTAAGTYIKTTKEQADQAPKKNKDRRVQILVVPDEWEKFQSFAHLAGTNPNSLINAYIRDTIEKHAKNIEQYEKQRDEMQKELGVKADE